MRARWVDSTRGGVGDSVVLLELRCNSPPAFNNKVSVLVRPWAVWLIHFSHHVVLCKLWQTRMCIESQCNITMFSFIKSCLVCGCISVLPWTDSSCLQHNYRRKCERECWDLERFLIMRRSSNTSHGVKTHWNIRAFAAPWKQDCKPLGVLGVRGGGPCIMFW